MSGIMLSLDVVYNGEPASGVERKRSAANDKHLRFIKKRRFLERKGLLKSKQVPDKQGKKFKQAPPGGPLPGNNQDNDPFSPNTAPNKRSTLKPTPSQIHTKLTLAKNKSGPVLSLTGSRSASGSSQSSNNSAQQKPSQSYTTCQSSPQRRGGVSPFGNPLKYLAMDCEMVGTGPNGRQNELARCSIVSYDGELVYDKYIMPVRPVTNFRTRWSGIRRHNLRNATPFWQAKKEILKILAGKVVVGHAIHNDFNVLHYNHPAALTRDTSCIPLLNNKAGFSENNPASLKKLTKAVLGREIQVGSKGHSSVEDAKATMELYKIVEVEWERTLASKSGFK